MLQFERVDDLRRHYAAVSARLRSPPCVAVSDPGGEIAEPAQEEVTPLQTNNAPEVTIVPFIYAEYRLTFRDVIEVVLAETGLTERQLWCRRRLKVVCDARHLAWALAKDLCLHLSLPAIGRLSGDRDHSTVLHGARAGVRLEPFDRLKVQLEDMRSVRRGLPITEREI